ncbi:hypothetical protein N824_24815 [Pedobacter sp. V48]|nr:hypothetical protein N824_24815 [Pedobacter sp. V48]
MEDIFIIFETNPHSRVSITVYRREAMGISLGLAIGLAIGAGMNLKAQKEGKVL